MLQLLPAPLLPNLQRWPRLPNLRPRLPRPMPRLLVFPPVIRSRTGIQMRPLSSCSEVSLMQTRWANGSTTGLSTTMALLLRWPMSRANYGCFLSNSPAKSSVRMNFLNVPTVARPSNSWRIFSIAANACGIDSRLCSRNVSNLCTKPPSAKPAAALQSRWDVMLAANLSSPFLDVTASYMTQRSS